MYKIAFTIFFFVSPLVAQSSTPTPTPVPSPTPEFSFQQGQAAYVVSIDTSTRDTSMSSIRLELERKAKEQFGKEKKFKVASSLKSADFVFLVAIDRDARDFDEIALAVTVPDYLANNSSIEKLRDAAIWQSDAHAHRGKQAAIGAATLGYGNLFRHPSVAKDLVKKFHQEVFK